LTKCVFCEQEVRPGSRLVYRRVIGWTRYRKGGGANQITLPEVQDVFACDVCVEKRKRGISPGQASLI